MRSGYGFLLLTSQLGDPRRKPLTTAQLRVLTQRIRWGQNQGSQEPLNARYLEGLGYPSEEAVRICALMNDDAQLERYLRNGEARGCVPVTRQNPQYPLIVRKRLGLDSPGALWCKGDLNILAQPAIALVGSRDLNRENRAFAREAGRQVAMQGFALVSGNARGADSTAQRACLEAGGQVVCVVADALQNLPQQKNVLYISEEDYDAPFSTLRALRRNRVIHAMGWLTLVAQSSLGKGGTWSGTTQNLRAGWSQVFCLRDGSRAALELEHLGAVLIGPEDLQDFARLSEQGQNLFAEIPF